MPHKSPEQIHSEPTKVSWPSGLPRSLTMARPPVTPARRAGQPGPGANQGSDQGQTFRPHSFREPKWRGETHQACAEEPLFHLQSLLKPILFLGSACNDTAGLHAVLRRHAGPGSNSPLRKGAAPKRWRSHRRGGRLELRRQLESSDGACHCDSLSLGSPVFQDNPQTTLRPREVFSRLHLRRHTPLRGNTFIELSCRRGGMKPVP
jgi:hypothetical protein